MIKNNLLGNYYPFFLDNKFGIGDVHYLYQIISPTYNKETCVPYFSLTKISEKSNYFTQSLPLEKDDDILVVCKNGMDNIRKGEKLDKSFDKVGFVCDNFLGQKVKIISSNPGKFPYIELGEENTDLQKTLIVSMRNLLRWKNYKLFPGRKVDILVTRDEFIIADIREDDEFIWLEPISLYKNKDIMLLEPLNISNSSLLESFKDRYKWKKEDFKQGDLSKLINKLEYESFNYRSIIKR